MKGQKFRYEANGRAFHQRPLVLGQLKQLSQHVLKSLAIPADNQLELSVESVMDLLGDKLSLALAIVLVEDSCKNLKQRDLEELADYIEENMPIAVMMQAVADFFELTPVFSLLTQFKDLLQNVLPATAVMEDLKK